MFKLSKSKNINLAGIYEKAEDLLNVIPVVKRRRRRRRLFRFLKYFLAAFLGLFLLLAVFFGPAFLDGFRAYRQARAGEDNLEKAIYLAKKKDFDQAAEYSGLAENDFSLAFAKVNEARAGFIVSRISILDRQLEDASYLIKSAQILAKSFGQGVVFAKDLQGVPGLDFSQSSQEARRGILKSIYESGPELNGLKANLDLAYLNLEKVESRGFLRFFKGKIEKFKQDLSYGQELASQAIPMTEIIPALAGYPQKGSFLVFIQNPDRLRPTGGFLGTFGILETDSGNIARLDTHDIYNLDIQARNLLAAPAPEPARKYLGNRWYMGDANWSPDFPTSAQQIEWFFKKENALLSSPNRFNDFDGLLSLSPQLVSELLAVTGPVFVDGQEYSQDSFSLFFTRELEGDYVLAGEPAWAQKQAVGRILKELKIKLFSLSPDGWLQALDVLRQNALEKNILLYFKDDRLQGLAQDLGWAGELREAPGDFLMVVDADLGTLARGAVISRSLDYQLEQGANGWFAKLRINYKHSGSGPESGAYKTYTRVYVPAGSKLIAAEGFTGGQAIVGEEAGKTYFGGFIQIEPGQIGSLYFNYKLPKELAQNISDSKKYELLAQKQGGNDIQNLTIDLKLKNKVKSYNPTGFYVEDYGEGVKWETDLSADRVFSVEF